VNNARIADLHRQAERSRHAGAFAQARRARRENSKDLADGAVGVFARRLLIILGARGA
jgi:hypothetical protein